MGYVSRARAAAERNAKQRKNWKWRSNKPVFSQVTTTDATNALMKMFPSEMRKKVLRKAVRAGGGPVRSAVRKDMRKAGPKSESRDDKGRKVYAPNSRIGRSSRTGTADKWSEKVKAARGASSRKWDMYQSVGIKVWSNQTVVIGMVGFRTYRKEGRSKRPGAQAWILENGASITLWGKGKYRLPGRPFLAPAGRTTLPQQRTKFVEKMKKEWTKI